MDMRIPPLSIKITFESNPLKSRILVRRLAVSRIRILKVSPQISQCGLKGVASDPRYDIV